MKQIKFNMDKIHALKYNYEHTIALCREEFSAINLNSHHQIKSYFRENYSFVLPDTKISTVNQLHELVPDGPLKEHLYALLTYLRSKYTLKNYIDCIIRHEEGGVLALREINGHWVMPNKQPISYNEEIIDAIDEPDDNIMQEIVSWQTPKKHSVI